LKSKKVIVTLTEKAKAYIAKIGYDKAMGARPLGRVISDKIKDPLVDEMLFGRLVSGGKVSVDYTDHLIFDYAV
jgi:ATP-dependent Clp protease ATP-binding subunit ClpA